LNSLTHALNDAVSENISKTQSVGVAFSGGVDSSLLAKLCCDLGKQVTLLTIGFPNSHDIIFSKNVAAKMRMKHIVRDIEYPGFQEVFQHIFQTIQCSNTSHLENCIAFSYILHLAKQNNLDLVLSANGCDELFCGYDKYRKAYCGGEARINMVMEQSLINEFELMKEIDSVAAQISTKIKQPFLSCKFIEFVKTIPIAKKIKGPHDMIRKHILREVALEIGVPRESALKPKKALQYGSSIHKYFRIMERRRKEMLNKGISSP
jgi:asparagine synthase (glutamine-hydrolysing)